MYAKKEIPPASTKTAETETEMEIVAVSPVLLSPDEDGSVGSSGMMECCAGSDGADGLAGSTKSQFQCKQTSLNWIYGGQ